MNFIFCPICGSPLQDTKDFFAGVKRKCSKWYACNSFEHEKTLTWESVHIWFDDLVLYVTWSVANYDKQGSDVWTIFDDANNGKIIATGSDIKRWNLNDIPKIKEEVETIALFQ
jgi:hypothetical protein